jgi:AbrB family looped-hinge helix DNA binding protein
MGKSRVGSKGEIFPPKEIRERLGLHAHTRVLYKVEDGRLIVEPILSLEEVLKEPLLVDVTLEEFHKFRKQLSQKAET